MKRRTKKEWLLLFEEQLNSNLSISTFSRKHHITPSYFYKRKSELLPVKKTVNASTFVKVKRPVVTPTVSHDIKIQYNGAQIKMPATIKPTWLAEFLKALS